MGCDSSVLQQGGGVGVGLDSCGGEQMREAAGGAYGPHRCGSVKAVVYGRETPAIRGKRGSEEEVVKWDRNSAGWGSLAASSARGSLRSTGLRQANLRRGVAGTIACFLVSIFHTCCVVVEATTFVA
jgi:hypothetical protein